jgi:hypothetical protein
VQLVIKQKAPSGAFFSIIFLNYIPTKIMAEVAAVEFCVTVGAEGVGVGAALELDEPPPPPQAVNSPTRLRAYKY